MTRLTIRTRVALWYGLLIVAGRVLHAELHAELHGVPSSHSLFQLCTSESACSVSMAKSMPPHERLTE